MHRAFLLLGSNLGDCLSWLAIGRKWLAAHGTLTQVSAIYVTAPWGFTEQPAFLNQAVELVTELSPEELLLAIEQIEHTAERTRDIHWGPRTLDIDILLYNDLVLATDTLQIPHPRMHLRRFVLAPLAEIAGDLLHPVLCKPVKELLVTCDDQSEVGILAGT